MIFNFVYLDKPTLTGYAAQVDGGVIAEAKTRKAKGTTAEATVGYRLLSGKVGGKSEAEHQITLSDAPEAQFQRLMAAGRVDPEAIWWNEILEPDTQFPGLQVGEIVQWECDVDIPVATRLLAKGGAGAQLLGLLSVMTNAGATGAIPGTPEPSSVEAAKLEQVRRIGPQIEFIQQLLEGVDLKQTAVGSDSDTPWKVFGVLRKENLIASDIDKERLIVVGKVKRVVAEYETRTMVSPAGFEQMAEMFNMPTGGRVKDTRPEIIEASTIHGPALELDILAICR